MTRGKPPSRPQNRATGLYDEQLQRQQQEKMLQRKATVGRRTEQLIEDPA